MEHIQGLCWEYGQRFASQVSMSSYQMLPPEAMSMIEPPERAWLVRLYAAGDELDRTTGQVEMIAVLQGDEVRLIFR